MAAELHLIATGGDAPIFHIDQAERRSRTDIIIDGELTGDYVGIAETCCIQVLAAGHRLCVFLREVSSVDESGRRLLLRLLEKGARLRGSGLYTTHIVRQLQGILAARRETGQ